MSLESINKLYNLTCEGQQFISVKPPVSLPSSYYSLVETCYNGNIITSVKGMYVGKDRSEMTECVLGDINVSDVLINNVGGYLNTIRSYINTISDEEKQTIIQGYDLIDLENLNIDETLESLFVVGVGSLLVYYHFMLVDQESIGSPFSPINFSMPVDTIDVKLLDNNMYDYISYPAKILINIPSTNHGKLWMSQITEFWNIWGEMFGRSLDLNVDTNQIIYDSIVGYSNYVYNQTSNIFQKFQGVETLVAQGRDKIEETTMEALKLVEGVDVDYKKKFSHATTLVTTIGTMVLKEIKAETDLSIGEISDQKEKLIQPFAQVVKDMELNKGQINDLTKESCDNIENRSKNCVKDVDSKIREINETIEEVRKHLKIYTTQNMQEIHQSKEDIIKCLYSEIHNIADKVRDDVGKIIHKNINKRIESKFSDVLCDYKQNAANRLSEVLEPVLIKKVAVFKEDTRKAIDQARAQVERARAQANRAEDLVTGIGCLEKRLKTLESGMSDSHIQQQIDGMKDDIDYLKDMVQKIAKTLNLR